MTEILGRLEKIDLRNVWASESASFTPWLALEENIALLSDALGIEREVGPFRADILCKDTASDAWVLIENQLERTDHTHLGQLLTYAAGLEAVTIVWIARNFTEEHRATLDWLNEITDDRFNFFGLEIEVWRIGNSTPAPKFNIVSQPNDWAREVSRGVTTLSQELTPKRQRQLDYWTTFRAYLLESGSSLKARTPKPKRSMAFALGRARLYMMAVASLYDSTADSWDSNELRTEVVIDTDDAKAHYALLAARKEELERGIGEPLVWHNPSDARQCRIYLRREADLENRAEWPVQHAWLKEKLETLHSVFGPIVRQLDANPADGDLLGK
jgi:hypothetical protein